MADTWSVPGYTVPDPTQNLGFSLGTTVQGAVPTLAQSASVAVAPLLSFGGAANPVPVGMGPSLSFGPSVPTVSASSLGDTLAGLFSLGSPAPASGGGSTGLSFGAATPLAHPGQQILPTAQANGQTGYVSATTSAAASILGAIGAAVDHLIPGQTTAATPAAYTTGASGGSMGPLLLIGALVVGGYFLLKHKG